MQEMEVEGPWILRIFPGSTFSDSWARFMIILPILLTLLPHYKTNIFLFKTNYIKYCYKNKERILVLERQLKKKGIFLGWYLFWSWWLGILVPAVCKINIQQVISFLNLLFDSLIFNSWFLRRHCFAYLSQKRLQHQILIKLMTSGVVAANKRSS